MPNMTLSWPNDAIADPASFVRRLIEAVNARPGGKVEMWCDHRLIGERFVATWEAKFTVDSDEHLTLIHDAVTAAAVPALEAR